MLFLAAYACIYNTVTSIKANASGIAESLINIDDDYYLMMLLVDNDGALDESDDPTQKGENNQDEKENEGASFTWIFYVLGVIGVLGGGFLIMRLRKRVRAA